MAEDPGNTELARLVQAGGAHAGTAEAELCRRFWQRARLYGLRHLRGVTEAEDLAQRVMEVMLTSLRRGRVDDLELLDRYMLGVCRNVAHTLRRSEERASRAARRLAREPALSAERPPEPPWGTHLVERLTSCLTELSRREQGVVQSSFSERRPSTEIAEQFGVTPGNVRVIRHRALRKLRDCLDRGGDPA
ncbi:MAG: sigma-70 family RNA polymerase sigma factor [Deltaproteobacteria bacterium]|nr:sigma-70 family RNA polymerase sigma factor [Deltaproteobacteria bacterium]MBW2162424.1 sigma-70 family RNA polymerase sigma factor [Deltaproteobacteria bacterium]MBW2377518.1 sigma-70 family RNA polymerase sigma factor [Deltaproteobacteria bacterium]